MALNVELNLELKFNDKFGFVKLWVTRKCNLF